MGLEGLVPSGVVTGENLLKLFTYCRENGVALPGSKSVMNCTQFYFLLFSAFNCTSTSTINAILQAARDFNSPVIIQFSNGGAAFLAGKGIKNTGEKAAILGAIAGAQHVRLMAKHYGVPVVLHSDHCAKVGHNLIILRPSLPVIHRNCCLGLTGCWRLMRNTSELMVSLSFPPTCWTSARSLMRRIFPPVSGISRGWRR